jgi:hypothetical protein
MLLPLIVALAVPPKILNMLSMINSLAPAPAVKTGAAAKGSELPQSLATVVLPTWAVTPS